LRDRNVFGRLLASPYYNPLVALRDCEPPIIWLQTTDYAEKTDGHFLHTTIEVGRIRTINFTRKTEKNGEHWRGDCKFGIWWLVEPRITPQTSLHLRSKQQFQKAPKDIKLRRADGWELRKNAAVWDQLRISKINRRGFWEDTHWRGGLQCPVTCLKERPVSRTTVAASWYDSLRQ